MKSLALLRAVGVVGLLLLGNGVVRAQSIVPISQDRSAFGFVIVPTCTPSSSTERVTAPDFGLFSDTALASLNCAGSLGNASGSIESNILPTAMFAHGEALSQGAALQSRTTIHAIADSTFLLTFDLTQDARIAISGTLNVQGGDPVGLIRSEFSIAQVNGPILFQHALDDLPTGEPDNLAFQHLIVLTPGRYRIIANASTILDASVPVNGTAFGDAMFSFNLTLRPPCPADVNRDGVVNSADFFDFLTSFLSGDPAGDFNHDGATDSRDFFAFLQAFFANCP